MLWLTMFPRFDVRYFSLYYSRIYSTLLQATGGSFRPQEDRRQSPSPAAMPQDYAVVQAHEGQAIHDGRLLPNPKFFTITPASPDIPPYLRLIHPTS